MKTRLISFSAILLALALSATLAFGDEGQHGHDDNHNPAPTHNVPEPTTAALMIAGIGMCAAMIMFSNRFKG